MYIGKLSDDRLASASRVAAIMGLSKWNSQNDELFKSIAAIDAGEARPETNRGPGNEQMGIGIELEEPILQMGRRRLDVRMDPHVDKVFKADDMELQSSVDAILYGEGQIIEDNPSNGIYVLGGGSMRLDGPGIGEAKNTRAAPTLEPAAYRGLWQVHAGMMCSGYKWGAIFTLFQGSELRVFLMREDLEAQQKIREAVTDFTSRLELYKRDGVVEKYPAFSPADGANAYATTEDDSSAIQLDNELSNAALELAAKREELSSTNVRLGK